MRNKSLETHIGKSGGEILPMREHYAQKKEKSEVDSQMNLTGEKAKRAREDMAAYKDLKEKLDEARFDAEQAYGDPEAAQRVRDIEEQLANYPSKHTEPEDAGSTMKIKKSLGSRMLGGLKKLLGIGRK